MWRKDFKVSRLEQKVESLESDLKKLLYIIEDNGLLRVSCYPDGYFTSNTADYNVKDIAKDIDLIMKHLNVKKVEHKAYTNLQKIKK